MKLISVKKLTQSYTRYDIEVKNNNNFVANGIVVHNCNARYVYLNGQVYCGSRREWMADHPKSPVWTAYRNTPSIEVFVKANPGYVLYGEAYGLMKNFKYDVQQNERVKFRAFDVFKDSQFLNLADAVELTAKNGVPWVPTVANIAYSREAVMALVDGPSLIAGSNNIREGIVIRPLVERYDPKLGRVIAKIINPKYYEKS